MHDPWRAVPAIGGHLSPTAGPADRRAIDERGDVATFTSEPLTQPLTLQGQPRLSVEASADQAGFDLCVALSRLPQHGDDVEQLSTGVMRVRGEKARQRSPRCVRLQPLLATLPKGDRLRLSIAGAAWPAIGVNSGSTSTGCGAPGMSHRVITMTLHLAGSHLTLIPAQLRQTDIRSIEFAAVKLSAALLALSLAAPVNSSWPLSLPSRQRGESHQPHTGSGHSCDRTDSAGLAEP